MLYPGRTLGIVGESGCGKSITARSILRIVDRPGRIIEGQILFRQQKVATASHTETVVDLAQLAPYGEDMRAIRGAEIALIFQEPMSSFSPVHTIGNQLIEAILLHQSVSKREARARALEVLRHVGIPLPEQRLEAYAYQLSGGLRQRAMIAMALSCNPSLLIADEPTTALDVTTQAQILDLMRRLQHEYGMAIMLITHDLGVVAEMADDVVVMYLGRVVEQAPVDEIFYAPRASLYAGVAALYPPYSVEVTRAFGVYCRIRAASLQSACRLSFSSALWGLYAWGLRPSGARFAADRGTTCGELFPLPKPCAVIQLKHEAFCRR